MTIDDLGLLFCEIQAAKAVLRVMKSWEKRSERYDLGPRIKYCSIELYSDLHRHRSSETAGLSKIHHQKPSPQVFPSLCGAMPISFSSSSAITASTV